MSNRGSGGWSEKFFEGKGFYIVLFLCAAVIGVSSWMLATGNRAMVKESSGPDKSVSDKRVETIIIPPAEEQLRPVIKNDSPEIAEEAPEMKNEGIAMPEAGEKTEAWNQKKPAEQDVYAWPLKGEIERGHSNGALCYDVTMGDWRTHEGVDILGPIGSAVTAAHAGAVSSIVNDELYGTTVMVDHGDGTVSVYSNLQDETAVSVGDRVEPGTLIGTVGATAICEISQCSHLHFAILENGVSKDPLEYLPC